MKILLFKNSGGFGFSDTAEEKLEQLGVDVSELWEEDVKNAVRINPIVIDYVEKNLEEAHRIDGCYNKTTGLTVVEIPDGVSWVIETGDTGYETLHYSVTPITSI